MGSYTPLFNVPNLRSAKIDNFNNRIEGYLSGKSIEKNILKNLIKI